MSREDRGGSKGVSFGGDGGGSGGRSGGGGGGSGGKQPMIKSQPSTGGGSKLTGTEARAVEAEIKATVKKAGG